jgi:hypothetical protein
VNPVVRRVGRASAALLALLGGLGGLGGLVVTEAAPAAAQTDTSTGTPTLELAGQSAWAPVGGGFLLRLQASGIPAGAQLSLTLHDRLQSRTAFDGSVNGGSLGSTRSLDRIPFDTIPTDTTGAKVVFLTAPQLSGGGVYPLEVDLRSADDQPIAGFVTDEVVADTGADGSLTVGRPLSVAWVWPLRAEPAYLPSGLPDPAVVADLEPAGRLGRQVATLAADPGVAVTLAPSPETLDAWQALAPKSPGLASGVASLRAAAAHDQVLTGPFVPLDYPSILAGGLAGILPDEQSRGVTSLESFLGAPLDPSTVLPGPLDATSLQLLQNANVRRLVVQDSALLPVTEKYTPAHPYQLQTVAGDASTTVTVAPADSGLERFLTGDDPPALRAAHLLAGLALVAGEQPSISRGVTLVNPDRWDADPTFIAAMLAGLQGNPLLRASTVSDLLTNVPVATTDGTADSEPLLRQLAPYKAPAPPLSLADYENARRDVVSVQNLVGATDPRALAGERALASSETALWANPAGRRKASALVGGIDNSVQNYLNQIEIPAQSTITITSSKADIPITMKNNGDTPITVHVALLSDRLLFPDGSERDVVLPPGRSTTLRIAVETRSSGTSPATMTVTAAGLPVGQPRQITVKSSFVSGVGLFLTIGAVVFLALWWGWDIHRRRKKGRAAHPAARFGAAHGQPA